MHHPKSVICRPMLMDPFLDVIQLLRPRATLWGRTDAVGRWGVSFRQRDDLLFCWVERGECQLVRQFAAPVFLRPNDFVLVRTSTSFSLTSDPTVKPLDSETIVSETRGLTLGEGVDKPVTLHGGRFVFDSVNESLLTVLLPQLILIPARDTPSWRVRSLLQMNQAESSTPGPGSDFIIVRLMELILVEILRNEALQMDSKYTGLLAGLADPVTACALAAMHRDVAHEWTVAGLARLCGLSRSSFAARFSKVMGMAPIEYLLQWRMALAKDQLQRGERSSGQIALAVGFKSSSAFSTAFTRAVGCAPKHFASRDR